MAEECQPWVYQAWPSEARSLGLSLRQCNVLKREQFYITRFWCRATSTQRQSVSKGDSSGLGPPSPQLLTEPREKLRAALKRLIDNDDFVDLVGGELLSVGLL